MKKLDYFLQKWRTRKAQKWIPKNARLLDIGCANAPLKETQDLSFYVGVDPDIQGAQLSETKHLISGKLDLQKLPLKNFDCVTMLAVWEHLSPDEQSQILSQISQVLPTKGKIILSIPSPAVDRIIDTLKALKILDGMKDDEHHGFQIQDTQPLFEKKGYALISHESFQLGLNHLFVFEKK